MFKLGKKSRIFVAEHIEIVENCFKIFWVVFPGVVVKKYFVEDFVIDLFILLEILLFLGFAERVKDFLFHRVENIIFRFCFHRQKFGV